LKSGEALIHSDVSFAALPAPVDSDLDQAEGLAAKNNAKAAIAIFTSIAVTHPDYDVRAYAHYRAGQFYLAQGDIWNGAEQAALIWDAKVSTAVQSSWRYRLLYDQTAYSVSESNDQETDLKVVNAAIKWDVTESPQLRFWRSLVAARLGKMERAKEDLKFILGADPHNVPYRALAAYIGVLTGDETELEALRNEQVDDVRALALLGQAAYLADKHDSAQGWWAAQAKIGVTQAKLDCLAGRKHVHYRQTRVAAALLAECIAVAPDSSEGKAAKSLLATLTNPVP
jgi:tetratricopeptide (TPR) repeat protein